MDIRTIKSFNRQLARVYTFAILQIIVSIAGLACIYFDCALSASFFCVIVCISCVTMIYIQPWQMAKVLHEGLKCQRELEAITGGQK